MIELPLVFLGGLLGSAHCVGMCGGFAVAIGMGSPSVTTNMRRQATYSLGRVFTYTCFGSIVGYAGLWLSQRAGSFIQIQAWLSLGAGVVLGMQALVALGVVPSFVRHWLRGRAKVCLAGTFVGEFLASPRWSSVFLAGVLTGFLPCGLVYGYLALAASTAGMIPGLATMAAFGAGTVPLMVLTGAGASVVSRNAQRSLRTVAAWCVLATALISLARGFFFLRGDVSVPCPACLLGALMPLPELAEFL